MAELAGFTLLFAFIITLLGIAAGFDTCLVRRTSSFRVLRRISMVLPFLLGLACFIMVTGFVQDWMNYEYIASHSARDLPLLYKLTALWSGMSGSLLFWAFILTVFGGFLALQLPRSGVTVFNGATLTSMLGVLLFFLYLLNWFSYPFKRVWKMPDGSLVHTASAPADAVKVFLKGQGLNPILRNPGMAFHPPLLYLGYVGLTIPFCLAVGVLVSGKLEDYWIYQSRTWTLVAWIMLTLGIVTGGWWAYRVLGWGGYWAWDPVENASLMPWLTATAFLHSVMIQKRRNMLKRWNVVLIVLTFLLSVFGTFLTRSGLLDSVHSFAENPAVGTLFMFFMGGCILLLGGFLLYRWEDLQSENQFESVLSREFMFLLNNMVLVGICFAVFWGTVFPVLSETFHGRRMSLGPSFFNRTTVPLFLLLLLLTGIGPLISWARASRSNLLRNFGLPTITAGLTALVLVWFGFRRFLPIISFSLCGFVTTTVVMGFVRGGQARACSTGESFPMAMFRLTWKARSRFGGYIVHLGIIVMVIGITASSAYDEKKEVTLNRGETIEIREYKLRYEQLQQEPVSNGTRVHARIDVFKNGSLLTTMKPGMDLLENTDQSHSRPDIRSTWQNDLYLVLSSWTQNGTVSLRVYHNPLVKWIWTGLLVVLFGGFLRLYPTGRGREPSWLLE